MTRVGWFLINTAQAAFTALWTLFWVPAALVVLCVTCSRRLPLAMARRCWAPGLLWGARARLDVRGLENVDFSKPHVFVANHLSTIDIPVLFRALPANVHFIIKRELLWVPFVGAYAWAMGMIFVDRADNSKAIANLKRMAHLIRGGRSVIAFPEGTRSRDGAVLPFKRGAFIAAIEAGVPIVPVAIRGSGQVLPRKGFRVRPGLIHVVVGKPFPTSHLSAAERAALPQAAREALISALSSLA
ncbi:MAG: 1-acyl-sn-glycerol-3-phosphate acyltransferase [Deltaproteobacteria bacterium]|nr:1-acyl-sn-glycerol-3-phosphate acyltransferase [Deltaproteobacteria bacterium]